MDGDRWAPLHETVEGRVESLALAHHASVSAARITRITRLTGDALDDLDLTGCAPVPEVAGLADTWWRVTREKPRPAASRRTAPLWSTRDSGTRTCAASADRAQAAASSTKARTPDSRA
ncbi:hypothetical protein [Amycolatopsis sp. WQ 127309]|uniref:hypothetical protein n=1 Tax=Amycolatopsis sp. WQ 127309 TaxID=2932773 RepID=UPI001FF15DAE|nr:hypothetical protein [Amycolatopsis sp. WQ 127309]UOZ03955.1 hypothetical protein MUY22_34595 [Amycolatopsis sp. WQ 127309]